MSFIDRVQIKLSSGKGGSGAIHFDRSRKSPRAGPDGGDGGKGGDLILSPTSRFHDLSHLKPFGLYKAEDGQPGEEKRKKGAKGKNLSVQVPSGTFCYDLKGRILMELTQNDKPFLIGGKGGKGNGFFKSARVQAPLQSQPGEKGKKKTVWLEMKWRSDACLIGLRDSGKSSLIYQLHPRLINKKVKPSVEPCQFSIPLESHINSSLLLVDLPGLSASTLKFLRQAERAHLLIFVISLRDSSPQTIYKNLKTELLKYDQKNRAELSKKPRLIVFTGNKTDDFNTNYNFQDDLVKKIFFPIVNSKIKQELLDEIICQIQ